MLNDAAMNMELAEQTDKQPCYTVSDKTIAEANKCKKDFSCLKTPHEALCLIDSCVNGKVHFIKCLNRGNCSYQGSFGLNLICHCPVRKELYNKYRV